MIQSSKRRVLFFSSLGFTAFALVFLLYRTRSDPAAFVTRAASVVALVGLAVAMVIELRQGRRLRTTRPVYKEDVRALTTDETSSLR